MGDVIALRREPPVRMQSALYLARQACGLSLLQAAKALKTSATVLEGEEADPSGRFELDAAKTAYQLAVASGEGGRGRNLLFNALPLRVARDVLGLSAPEIAVRSGVSLSHWRKLECNAREIDQALLEQLEKEVEDAFGLLCSR